MRVLIVLGRGDLSCRLESAIAALRARGHDVDAVGLADARRGGPYGPTGRPLPGGDSVAAAYRRLRAHLPARPRLAAELGRRQPDVVVGCPLVDRSTQERLHAAARLGIPTAAGLTWEDGSARAALATLPDAVLVWSPRLARQARAAYAIPRDRVVVTGAAAFDGWFDRQPPSRPEVCARLGVDPASPYLLHASPPPHSATVAELRAALAAEPRTRRLAVAVAPSPHDDPQGLFDAVSAAAAVAGADPVAFVAAAIADRPCVMVATERRRADEPVRDRLQDVVKGRFVQIAEDSGAAVTALAEVMEGQDSGAQMRRRFLSTFIRPVGLDRPAGDVVADAILQTAARGVRPPEPVLPSRRAALPGRVKVGKVRQPPREEEERRALLRLHDEHPIPIRQPLALVAALAGPGGELLVRLLDGHPQLHARAGCLRPGGVDPPAWPRLDLSAGPDAWWEALREPGPPERPAGATADERPFLLSPTLQRRVFDHCVASWRIERQRDVLDAAMTAYFNAWLDYQSLYGGDRRWVCASGGELGLAAGDRAGFFGDYPDGRLMVVVEPPVGDDQASARRWTRLAETLVQARADDAERLLVVPGRELATAPEPVMRQLALWLGIDFDPILCRATFNRMPVRAPAQAPAGGGADGRAGDLYRQLVSAPG